MLVLVQCPIIGATTTDLAPPLGLMRIAQSVDMPVQIVDLNLSWQLNRDDWKNNWHNNALKEILSHSPDIVGFTSMAIDTHIAIELSNLLKKEKPNISIICGGSHMGLMPEFMLKNYGNHIDVIVTGESESIINDLCNTLLKNEKPKDIPGVSYKSGNSITINPPGDVVNIENLNAISFEYFDLENYWKVNKNRLVNIEFSRGCKFNCSFCYSTPHFGETPRYMTPKMAADNLAIADSAGANHAFIVDDNFLNNKKWALEVCSEISSRSLNISWSCYTTIPGISQEIADALSQANCRLVYIGADAIEPNQQNEFSKNFFSKWDSVREKLQLLRTSGIVPECAFILAGLFEQRIGTEANIRAAVDVATRGNALGIPRINVLAQYGGTKLYEENNLFKSISTSARIEYLQDVPEFVKINKYSDKNPDEFPFHSMSSDPSIGINLILLGADIAFLLWYFPRTLLSIMHIVTSNSTSNTPFVDWWEENILVHIDKQNDAFSRQVKLEQIIKSFVKNNETSEFKIIFELEEKSKILSSMKVSENKITVEGKEFKVKQSPLIGLSNLINFELTEIEISILKAFNPIINNKSGNGQGSWKMFCYNNKAHNKVDSSIIFIDNMTEKLLIKDDGYDYFTSNCLLSSEQFEYLIDSKVFSLEDEYNNLSV